MDRNNGEILGTRIVQNIFHLMVKIIGSIFLIQQAYLDGIISKIDANDSTEVFVST